MTDKTETRNEATLNTTSTSRKAYRKPQLNLLGDLRSLTLGGSPGIGESGGLPRKVKTGLGHGMSLPEPPGTPTPGFPPLPKP